MTTPVCLTGSGEFDPRHSRHIRKESMKFANGDRVECHSTTDIELDGIRGTVVGIAHDLPEMTVYIVMLDYRYPKNPNWDAIILTEHCLNKV